MYSTNVFKTGTPLLKGRLILFCGAFFWQGLSYAQVGINNSTAVNKLDVVGDTASPGKTGFAANSIARFGTTGSNSVLDLGIAKDNYGWLQLRNSGDYSSPNIPLLINPNGGNVGIGYAGTQTSNMPNEKLSVDGGIRASGKIISASAGQLLHVVALTESDLPLSNNPTRYFSSTSSSPTTEGVVASYSYTPQSSSSKWIIEFDADVLINGSAADEFETYIYVGSTLVQTVRSRFDNSDGGGGRGNGIFPIIATYDNASSSAQSVSVRIKRVLGDDYVDVYNDLTLIIKEIAR